MRPVELGGSLVPGTGLTLIRKKLKCSFVLLRVVSYEDVPKKEQAWNPKLARSGTPAE
jgi:hypothetical protein